MSAIPHDSDAPVYLISVAAVRCGLHPQTLRQYDRYGLVTPRRASGRSRRYSEGDIDLLKRVAELSAQGIPLRGIRIILELEREVQVLRAQAGRAGLA